MTILRFELLEIKHKGLKSWGFILGPHVLKEKKKAFINNCKVIYLQPPYTSGMQTLCG